MLDVEQCARLILTPERDAVYARADQRFDQMLAAGALDEVRALKARALDPSLPAMRALGRAPAARTSGGRLDLETAVNAAKAETRQFIKRQQTWIKGNMSAWNAC